MLVITKETLLYFNKFKRIIHYGFLLIASSYMMKHMVKHKGFFYERKSSSNEALTFQNMHTRMRLVNINT
ncbi:hypothetical protein C1H46_041195 [Malus baccata]|uniref:Uncharacterized protein n=1 Tax=Malus baccata TaxID=106549 RepID=A0A540KGC2_MALBA|nr:hypothetical protein C1H46_041195 [Malus baccata]